MTSTRRQRRARVSYDARKERFEVTLVNGAAFSFPVALVPTVRDATPAERADVRISTRGEGLRWDALDLDILWPYLAGMLLGHAAWRRSAAAAPGRVWSPARVRPSRESRKKGGRPRKTA